MASVPEGYVKGIPSMGSSEGFTLQGINMGILVHTREACMQSIHAHNFETSGAIPSALGEDTTIPDTWT